MKRKIAIWSGGAVVALAGIIAATVILWRADIIELPAVAVRSIGRVASLSTSGAGTSVQLPVPFHKQEHSLSCEVATLKMALQRYNINVPESELIHHLPFDPTPKSGGVWGDPNKGFVGSIDGKMLVDGYGVYWDPLADLGMRYARTEVIRGSTPEAAAAHLAAGRPVIIWGYSGRNKPFNWRSSEGKIVSAVNGEHTRVLTGFSGPATAPTHFSLIDPIYGPETWTTAKLMDIWTSLGRNGVVVYGHPQWVRVAGDPKIWEVSKDGSTRRWVKSWQVFRARGGFPEAVVTIDNKSLLKYKQGNDITN